MSEILWFLQAFAMGWVAARIYMAYKITKAIKKIAKENNIDLDELTRTVNELDSVNKINVIKVPNLVTEKLTSSILLYCKDTGDFIAQGSSVEELAENAYKFKNIKFAFVKHEEKEFWFVEGKIRNDLKEI